MKAVSERQSAILGVKTYVLEDGRVVVTATHLHEAFALQRPGNVSSDTDRTEVPRFAASKNLKPFVSEHLQTGLKSPVEFKLPDGRATALGYDSDVLADLAVAIVTASIEGVLYTRQHKMAKAAAVFVRATTRLGARLALLDEHGMQPRAGAAAALQEALTQEVGQLHADLERTRTTLREQSEGNARAWAKVGELERRMTALSAGAVSPQQLDWMKEMMREVASLRRRPRPDLTFDKLYARVQADVRERMRYTLEWDEFPYARFDDLRQLLRRLHKTAIKEAREVGYDGQDTWMQPPLPFLGQDDESEDDDV